MHLFMIQYLSFSSKGGDGHFLQREQSFYRGDSDDGPESESDEYYAQEGDVLMRKSGAQTSKPTKKKRSSPRISPEKVLNYQN